MAIRKKSVRFRSPEKNDPGILHKALKINLPLNIDLAILLNYDRIYQNLEAIFFPFLSRLTEQLEKEHPLLHNTPVLFASSRMLLTHIPLL